MVKLFRKPKLTKKEKQMLKRAEHDAFFKAKLEKAKLKGKRRASRSKLGTVKTIAKYMQKASENARKNMERLEKEYG